MKWLWRIYDYFFPIPKKFTPKGRSLEQYFYNEIHGIPQSSIEEYDNIIIGVCAAIKEAGSVQERKHAMEMD